MKERKRNEGRERESGDWEGGKDVLPDLASAKQGFKPKPIDPELFLTFLCFL